MLVYEDEASFPDSMTSEWDGGKIASALASFFNREASSSASASIKARRKHAATTGDTAGTGAGGAPAASIDVLITFDRGGVSGHPNHVALYHGAVAWLRLLMKGRSGWECPVALYRLTSTNLLRKYLGLLDAPLTMVLCWLDSLQAAGRKGEREVPRRLMFLSDLTLFRRAQKAMTAAHVSQMRWFRWGWICLSRYMYVNDLKREKLVFR